MHHFSLSFVLGVRRDLGLAPRRGEGQAGKLGSWEMEMAQGFGSQNRLVTCKGIHGGLVSGFVRCGTGMGWMEWEGNGGSS